MVRYLCKFEVSSVKVNNDNVRKMDFPKDALCEIAIF